MMGGWRFITIQTIVSLIQYIHDPPTNGGDLFEEVMTPRTGNQPMRIYYGIYIQKFQLF